jgi:hypothetical protein
MKFIIVFLSIVCFSLSTRKKVFQISNIYDSLTVKNFNFVFGVNFNERTQTVELYVLKASQISYKILFLVFFQSFIHK